MSSQRRIPFAESTESSRQAHSHGRLSPESPSALTGIVAQAPSGRSSASRSIFFLRPWQRTALVLGTISAYGRPRLSSQDRKACDLPQKESATTHRAGTPAANALWSILLANSSLFANPTSSSGTPASASRSSSSVHSLGRYRVRSTNAAPFSEE